ncbi:MAG: hypothetical protein AAF251_00920 [Pseudomonadota bacterium]
MNGATLASAFAGLLGFLVGAYLASTGDRLLGISIMAMGLMFQALALRQLKLAKKAYQEDEGSNDAG